MPAPKWLAIGVYTFALFMILIGTAFGGTFVGSQQGVPDDQKPGSSTVDCSGVANVPKEYLGWVKEATQKEIGGDEAILTALIQVESGWGVKAKNASSTATGLGQFITSTARGMRKQGRGFVSNDPIYDNPDPNAQGDDARFDAQQSIFASANYFGANVRVYLSKGQSHEEAYYNAYYRNYHGFSNEQQRQESEAGAKRMMEIYKKLKDGGGCKDEGPTGTMQELACQVKDNRLVDLATSQSTGPETSPAQNIADVCTGKLAANGLHQQTDLNPGMLQGILAAAGQYRIYVSSIAGATHMEKSLHYPGRAVDIAVINGKSVASIPESEEVATVMRLLHDSAGADNVGGPRDLDGPGGVYFTNDEHKDHIHAEWEF